MITPARAWLLALALLAACRRHEGAKRPADAPAPSASAAVGAMPAGPGGAAPREKLDAAEVAVPPGKSTLHVAWELPAGTGINDDAPFSVRWGSSDGLSSTPGDIHGFGKDVSTGFDVRLDVMPGAVGAQLAGDIDLVVCDVATHSICVPLKRRLELTFAVTKGSAGTVSLPLPQAKP